MQVNPDGTQASGGEPGAGWGPATGRARVPVTLWATWKETRSLKWTLMALVVPLVMAALITLFVHQTGRLLGL